MAASALIIKSLGDGPAFILTLTGRALPNRSFKVATKMRGEVTFYQGNPEGVAQIFGSEEGSTTISGTWKTKFIAQFSEDVLSGATIDSSGNTRDQNASPNLIINTNGSSSVQNLQPARVNGVAVQDVGDLIAQLDDFVRAGQSVEVTWGPITRHGYIDTFEADYEREEDVKWSITFNWTSRGQPTTPVILALQTGISNAGTELTQQAQALTDTLAAPKYPLLAELAADFDEVAAKLNTLAGEVQQAVINTSTAILAPLDSARRVAAQMNSAVGEAGNLLTSVYGSSMSELRGLAQTADVTVGQMYQAAQFANSLYSTANQIRSRSRDRQEALNRQLTADVSAVYTARGGEDLRDVATKFFGVPDNWLSLLTHNRLNSSLLIAGQKIRVPSPKVR